MTDNNPITVFNLRPGVVELKELFSTLFSPNHGKTNMENNSFNLRAIAPRFRICYG